MFICGSIALASLAQIGALACGQTPPWPLIGLTLRRHRLFVVRQQGVQPFVLVSLTWVHHVHHKAAGAAALHWVELRRSVLNAKRAIGQFLDRALDSIDLSVGRHGGMVADQGRMLAFHWACWENESVRSTIMPTIENEVNFNLEIDGTELPGTLRVPANSLGTVIFAHGSGSSRFSPRNVAVALELGNLGLATYLFDLLDPFEAMDRRNVFDVKLLAKRMVLATRRVREHEECRGLPIGYFGASTGAAAALVAAAELGDQIAAVVSRGGRPDLAGAYLPRVTAPTLLLVGSLDFGVIELNEKAQRELRCENRLSIVEGATHLFEEPGTLEEVSRQATEWFISRFAVDVTGKPRLAT
jgi:pimeloyl-ACP methyl ester carboxylesterase